MPWEHCGVRILDDDQSCPTCGKTKAQWTVDWNVTRTFRLGRDKGAAAQFRVTLLDAEGMPVADEPFVLTLADGTQVEGRLDRFGFAKVASPGGPGAGTVRFPGRRAGEFPPKDGAVDGAAGGAELSCSTEEKRTLRLAPPVELVAARFERELSNRDRSTVLLAELRGAAEGTRVRFQVFARARDGAERDVGPPVEATAEAQRARAPWQPDEGPSPQPEAPPGTERDDAVPPPDVPLTSTYEHVKVTASPSHVAGELLWLRAEAGGRSVTSQEPLRWTLDVDLLDDLGDPLPDHAVDVLDLDDDGGRRRARSDAQGRLRVTGLTAPVALLARGIDDEVRRFDPEPVLGPAPGGPDLLHFLLGEDEEDVRA